MHYAKELLQRNIAFFGSLAEGREVSMETWEDAADFCHWQPRRTGLASKAQLLSVVSPVGGKQ